MDQLKDIIGQGFGEKVLDYMKQLAMGLGVAVDHVYQVLVKQQIVWGVAAMIGFGLGILIISSIVIWTWRGKPLSLEGVVAITIFGLLFIGGFIIGFLSGFMHIYNPEYYAIREVVSAISGK